MVEESKLKKLERRRMSRERKRALARDEFVKAALSTPQGRDYFYWLIEICHVGRNPFTGNALTTAFQSGELNVGQQIQSHIIDVAPKAYFQMLEGRKEEEENDNRDADDATGGNTPDDSTDESGDSTFG